MDHYEILEILNTIELASIFSDKRLDGFECLGMDIGNDDRIYLLFAQTANPSERRAYKAICLMVDWDTGGFFGFDVISFGTKKDRFYFVQPLGDGYLLLSDYAHIVDRFGSPIKKLYLGDGIAQCYVDRENNIITSYCDEGVYGSGRESGGMAGIVKWSADGKMLWENKTHVIDDCYAMNIDCDNHLWYYYYNAFNLVHTDYVNERVFAPRVTGSNGFLISRKKDKLLFHKGYQKNDRYCVIRVTGQNTLSKPVDCKMVYSGQTLKTGGFVFAYRRPAQFVFYLFSLKAAKDHRTGRRLTTTTEISRRHPARIHSQETSRSAYLRCMTKSSPRPPGFGM
ncbi:MAG: hypothetical protein LBT26_02410 [Clostridiales Family XIII bacterium]|nr:hypothetical protein [Clostridiales Family XIII bacterium]